MEATEYYSPVVVSCFLLSWFLLPFVVNGRSQATQVGTAARTLPSLVEAGMMTWSCFERAASIASITRPTNLDLASSRMVPASGLA